MLRCTLTIGQRGEGRRGREGEEGEGEEGEGEEGEGEEGEGQEGEGGRRVSKEGATSFGNKEERECK